jgi:hypothetical protein
VFSVHTCSHIDGRKPQILFIKVHERRTLCALLKNFHSLYLIKSHKIGARFIVVRWGYYATNLKFAGSNPDEVIGTSTYLVLQPAL